MRRFLLHLFTLGDNKTFDLRRVLWAWAVLSFTGMVFYALHRGGNFDPVGTGTGLAAVLAAGGAAIGMTPHAEAPPAT